MNDDTPAPPDRSGDPGRYPARIDPGSTRVPRTLYADDWDDEIRFGDYWRVLVARRWTILGVLATVVAGTMLWTLRQVPLYRATSRIQIEREDPSILSFENVYSAEAGTDDGLQTQFEIIGSRTLARRVVDELTPGEIERYLVREESLADLWMAGVREFFAPGGEPGAGDPLDEVVDGYLERLTVSPVRQARLVDISFEHEDPEFASRVIDIHADHFIDQNLRFRFEATQLASDFLSENLTNLKINLERAEDELQEYGRSHQILFSEDGNSTALQKLQQLEADHTEAQNDRIAKEAYIQVLEEGDARALAQVANDDLIASLSAELTALRAEAAELETELGPRMPEIQRLERRTAETERQLETATANVLQTVRAEYRAAVGREELLSEAVARQLGLVNDVNQEIVQYTILKGEVDASRQLYQEMLTRLGEANVSSTLRASNIRIIDRATVPDRPVKPRKALNLALSLLVGLGLGVGIAFFQEHMDDSIQSTDDVGQYLEAPTLGIVPRGKAAGKAYGYRGGYGRTPAGASGVPVVTGPNRIEFISHNEPASMMAEAYRSARTSLLLSFPDNPPRSILITSPSPAEGKTATAINIAISLTQTGARTLLVSTDLRKPRVDEVLGTQGSEGLAGVLAGSTRLEDAICETGVPHLSFFPCGALPPNPVELLMSNRFETLVARLREQFDFIVFDSPPVGNVSDARVMARMMDCTILVVRAAQTSKHLARHVMDQLRASGSRTAGVILNDFDQKSAGTSYYYPMGYYRSSSA